MATQLKAYDIYNRLWISKPTTRSKALQLLNDLNTSQGITIAWLKSGKTSEKVPLPTKPKHPGSVRYIGSDGIITRTIPSRLSAYPFQVIQGPKS